MNEKIRQIVRAVAPLSLRVRAHRKDLPRQVSRKEAQNGAKTDPLFLRLLRFFAAIASWFLRLKLRFANTRGFRFTLTAGCTAWVLFCLPRPAEAAESLRQKSAGATGPLRVHPTNPRYLTNDGQRAIYLTGSHTWLNCQDGGPREPVTPFDNQAYLDVLTRHDHNFIRLWIWDSTAWAWNRPEDFKVLTPEIFVRTGPGKALDDRPKFDLTQLNQALFDRVRERVIAAGRR